MAHGVESKLDRREFGRGFVVPMVIVGNDVQKAIAEAQDKLRNFGGGVLPSKYHVTLVFEKGEDGLDFDPYHDAVVKIEPKPRPTLVPEPKPKPEPKSPPKALRIVIPTEKPKAKPKVKPKPKAEVVLPAKKTKKGKK